MPRIIITEPGKSPQPYRLKIDRQTTNIGRGADNDVLIDAGSASTHHCVMERVSGGFILEDLNSTNGIKTNDTLYKIIDLVDEMIIHLGDDVSLEFTLTEEELDTLGDEDFESHEKLLLPKSKKNSTPEIDDEEDEEVDSEPEDDFDEEEEEEEEPKPTPKRKRKKRPPVVEESDDDDEWHDEDTSDDEDDYSPRTVRRGNNPLNGIIFFILVLAAIALGFYIRHKQDVLSKPLTPAPVETTTPPTK